MFSAVSVAAEPGNEPKYYCPLNAEYLLHQLSAMEALPLYPTPEQVDPLIEHTTRMSVEELKDNIIVPRDSCDYFKLSLKLEGLKRGSDEYPEKWASYSIAELLTEVERCKKWITENISEKHAPIASHYCK